MTTIPLPEAKLSMEGNVNFEETEFNIQSLLHAVSNKEKVRNDIDDVEFIKHANRSISKKKKDTSESKPNPLNIFNHIKHISETIEKEDAARETPPSPQDRRSPRRMSTPSPPKHKKSTPPRHPSPPRRPPSPPRREYSPAKSHRSDRGKDRAEEKAMLLQTFFLLQQQGVKSDLKLDIGSDIRIIQSEVTRMQTELNSQKMIKFMRKGLIAFVSGLEFLNSRYDPIGLKLNGYSEHVMTSLGDYDGVFLRLYDKYKDRTQVLAPEVELLMLLLGSMMMFHLTQSFVTQTIPQFAKENKKPHVQEDSDDDDIESVATENFKPRNAPTSFNLPTDILSTPAFPAMVQRMISERPTLQPPRTKMETIPEVKEIDVAHIKEKKENVLIIS